MSGLPTRSGQVPRRPPRGSWISRPGGRVLAGHSPGIDTRERLYDGTGFCFGQLRRHGLLSILQQRNRMGSGPGLTRAEEESCDASCS
jgi:hypothetical protein